MSTTEAAASAAPAPKADDLAVRVTRLIAEQLFKPEAEVTPEKSLQADLDCDSLDEVELVMSIEDEFGIVIDGHDEAAMKMTTVQSVIDFVRRKTTT